MFDVIAEIILEQLPGKIRTFLERNFFGYDLHPSSIIERGTKILYNDKKNKGNFVMKKYAWIGRDCTVDITDDVVIGEYVEIAPNVSLFTHDSSVLPVKKSPIVIDDHVYIGTGAIILCGVKIGKNSVIGAGSVVTKDVKPNTIVVGVPAKVIKKQSKRR